MKVACTVWLGAKGVKASDLSRFLLNSEYSAKYLQQLWKKVRKQGGLCTGITQNVVDPVFIAQHATATCCRECIRKWHKMQPGRELSQVQQDYLVDVIMTWIQREMERQVHKS